MQLIGNIIWFILGGFLTCIGYLWGGLLLSMTIVGIPWALQLIKLGIAHIAPFGKKVQENEGNSPGISLFLNLVWIIFAGFWIALIEMALGILLCATIIGIPFGLQHFKLMRLAFAPFGHDLR